MANLREAYDYAKNNPESDFAKKLESTLASGALDSEAQKYGIDTSVFKPQVQPAQQIQKGENVSFGRQIGKAILDPLSKGGATLAKIALPESLETPEMQQGYTPSVLGGKVDLIGYKDGRELQGVELTKDIVGSVLEGVSYLPMAQALKGGKLLKLAKEGATSGALAGSGSALQNNEDMGGVVEETIKQGVAGSVLGPILGKTSEAAQTGITKAFTTISAPEKAYQMSAIKQINKALSVQGKKSIGQAVNVAPEKRLAAFETMYDVAPEIKVKDDFGQEVAFNPKETNFRQFGEALYKAKKNLWGNVDSELKKASAQGLEVDITPTLDELNAIANSKFEPLDVRKKAIELSDELAGMVSERGTVPVDGLAGYNSKLNMKITGQLQGTSNNALRAVEANAAKQLSESVDKAVEGVQGAGFAKLKDQYSSLKAIENDTVRRMQQELRMLDTGIADFMGQYGTSDMIAGVIGAVQGNPAQFIKGASTKVVAEQLKKLREPSNYLRKAFGEIEKYKSGKGITPALEQIKANQAPQSFSKATVPQTVRKETKGDVFWREYLKNAEVDRKINARVEIVGAKRPGPVNEYGQRVIYPGTKEELNPITEYESLSGVDKKALITFLNKQPNAEQEAFVSGLTERLNAEKSILEQLQGLAEEKVKPLLKYESKRGEFKGQLNLNNGKGRFGKKYDDILPGYFDPSGTGTKYSEDMVDEYYSLRDSWRQQKETVSRLKKELKSLKGKKSS